jgi:hypothetical protein
MKTRFLRIGVATAAIVALSFAGGSAQSNAPKEDFTAIAMVNNNLGSGAGTVLISVTRWSTEAEGRQLVNTLQEKGAQAMLEALIKMPRVGTIRTPDSLGYDLHYARQTPGEDGGRNIVIATDRPISFWEARNQPRSIDYPFTVIQLQMKNGKGKGTLSYATKIQAANDVIELENFATAPVMLTEVTSKSRTD